LTKAVDAAALVAPLPTAKDNALFSAAQFRLRTLKKSRRLKKLIMDLNNNTIAELKSYDKPPEGVLPAMQVKYLFCLN